MVLQKKKPLLAGLLSFLIMGMGQVYNRQYGRAAWYWAIPIISYFTGFYRETFWTISWIVSIIDAYLTARLTIHEESYKHAVNITVIIVILVVAFIGIAILFTFFSEEPSTAATLQLQQKSCENNGNVWCNGKCYNPCSSTEKLNCPLNGGQPTCEIDTKGAEKSIVYIKYDASGCCDSYGQVSSQLGGSGSGVIYYKNDSTIRVLTSRHVVDCVFSGTCIYPTSKKITIRTQSGSFYTPTQIWHAPKNLDLALLEFQATDSINPAILNFQNYSIGDNVTAIGYPAFGVQSAEPILEFSVTDGSITDIRSLLTYQGLSFTAIQSDALVNHGSSGGGLFNQYGQLTGIITWGNREQKVAIAIDTKVLSEIDKTQEQFRSCPSGSYHLISENGCCQYGTIVGSDGKCYQPCGNPNSICPSPNICMNNRCYAPCASGYILGDDGACYPKCGESYCSQGSVCYNNQCVSCSSGYILGSDGKCHQPCGSSTTYCSGNSICFNNQCVSCQTGYYLGTDGRCHPS